MGRPVQARSQVLGKAKTVKRVTEAVVLARKLNEMEKAKQLILFRLFAFYVVLEPRT